MPRNIVNFDNLLVGDDIRDQENPADLLLGVRVNWVLTANDGPIDIGHVRGAHHGDEDLRRTRRARGWVDHRHPGAGVIDEHPLARGMTLAVAPEAHLWCDTGESRPTQRR